MTVEQAGTRTKPVPCRRCRRPLRSAEAIARGIGRKCAARERLFWRPEIEAVTVNGEPLRHVRKHSEGFEWGYGGSGPADLALSILVDFFNHRGKAERLYQRFKWDFVAKWGDSWRITGQEIFDWMVGLGITWKPARGNVVYEGRRRV